ncbi:MAG: superoxide dismutase [Candidatus Micrarchaeia archaeon]|jgi:Fe-Mn family superoxide dismutase
MEIEGLHKYELRPLPYSIDALEPYISKEIVDVHYNGHHKGYVNTANTLMDRLNGIIKGDVTSYDLHGVLRAITFNINGAKLHEAYWNNMAPSGKGGGTPGGKLADLINKQYGSFERFKKLFTEAANSNPGTGWALLVYDRENSNLQILTIENHFMNHIAEMPTILILDEFEHAYYLQYKNKRADYVANWWNIVNWDDAEKRLEKEL